MKFQSFNDPRRVRMTPGLVSGASVEPFSGPQTSVEKSFRRTKRSLMIEYFSETSRLLGEFSTFQKTCRRAYNQLEISRVALSWISGRTRCHASSPYANILKMQGRATSDVHIRIPQKIEISATKSSLCACRKAIVLEMSVLRTEIASDYWPA